jgi:glc operon protein GlcG
MPIQVLVILTLAAGLLGGTGARAEPAPAPPVTAAPPAGPSPAPEYGLALNNEQVKMIASAALAEARRNSWRMSIAIVGPDGELLYFERMDGTQNAGPALAQRKARTSALYRRPTKVFVDQFAAGNIAFMTFPDEARPIASEGGLPIIVGGRLVGAIGVSGGTGAQDGVVATAAINALK